MSEFRHSFVLPEFTALHPDFATLQIIKADLTAQHELVDKNFAERHQARKDTLVKHVDFPFTDYVSEKVLPSEYFRGSEFWHIDGAETDEPLTLMASSCPTIFAETTLVFKDPSIAYKDLGVDVPVERINHYKNTTVIVRLLRFLDTEFGHNWLEVAAGKTEPQQHQAHLSDFVAVVNQDLTIVQALPWTVSSGRRSTLLHQSAKWHNSQPDVRTFARRYIS
jgi:hypothetical protein